MTEISWSKLVSGGRMEETAAEFFSCSTKTSMLASETPPPHGRYPTRSERAADLWIHVLGIAFALLGGVALVGAALPHGIGRTISVAAYAMSLLTMFTVSAASNLSRSVDPRRRLENGDEAAIFVMIAGSYTPFTTQVLEGPLAIGMTLSIWCLALAAAAGKLFLSRVSRRIWMLAYLVLGWFVVLAAGPLAAALPSLALILLVGGGIIYTAGTIFYASARLPFRRAIWHGFVLMGAALHFGAISTGIVWDDGGRSALRSTVKSGPAPVMPLLTKWQDDPYRDAE